MLPVPNGLPPELGDPDRADGGRLARGPPRRGQEGRRRGRDRLRAGRARGHLHAEGARRARRSSPATSPPAGGRWRARAAPTSWWTRARTRRSRRSADHGHLATAPRPLDLAVGDDGEARRLPVGWRHLWRAAERSAIKPKARSIFECVGVPGDHRRDHRRGAVVLARRRRRRLHGTGHDPPGDGDQQGDRPALRGRLHAARVPRHAAHARRGQGRPRPARHRDGRARPASTARSTTSATPRRTRRSSSTRAGTRRSKRSAPRRR